MLEQAPDGFSPRGVVHAFTDRSGGVSEGRFASLNFGQKWGDDPAAVAENVRRVAAAVGFDPALLRLPRQVHGAAVLRAREGSAGEADAIWAARCDGAVVVGVLTADCVPVLLVDDEATVVAAIHSGWRSTVAGVVPATIAAISAATSTAPERLRAAVGPCIELASFEVGPEVAALFPKDCVEEASYPRPHVDLVKMVRTQLVACGVREEKIWRVGACTFAHPARYFSFRRDGAGIGQMLSLIGWP